MGGRRASARMEVKESSRYWEVFVILAPVVLHRAESGITIAREALERPIDHDKKKYGAIGDRVSSMATMVDIDGSETVARQPMSERMWIAEGW